MRRVLAVVLLTVGVVALVVGFLYITQPAHSLPSFFPGYVAHGLGKHTKRGYAGIALGALLVVLAFILALSGPRRRPLR